MNATRLLLGMLLAVVALISPAWAATPNDSAHEVATYLLVVGNLNSNVVRFDMSDSSSQEIISLVPGHWPEGDEPRGLAVVPLARGEGRVAALA